MLYSECGTGGIFGTSKQHCLLAACLHRVLSNLNAQIGTRCNHCCNANNCSLAVAGIGKGVLAQSSHKKDCNSYLQATVIPPTST